MKNRFLFPALFLLFIPPSFSAREIISQSASYPAFGSVERLDLVMDDLIAPRTQMEELASGFTWSEGPVWIPSKSELIFTDVPENVAYRWKDGEGVSEFLNPSGLPDKPGGGANGLMLDKRGRLLLCQHNARQVARLHDDGKTFEPVATRWKGKRFNSPNDLILNRQGQIFFTDPPFGLKGEAKREIDWQGIYRIDPDGTVTLLFSELERPNGISLSPDEKTLYVNNSFRPRPNIRAFDVTPEGNLENMRVFFEAGRLYVEERQGPMDGMAVDVNGNLWTAGPGGVLIISPKGTHLGSLLTGRPTANCTFGGEDGSVLYITANDRLLRIQTLTTGLGY